MWRTEKPYQLVREEKKPVWGRMGGGKLRKTEVAPCPDERGDQGAQSLRTLFNIIRRDPRRKDLGSADSPRFAGAGGFWVRARMGDGGSARASRVPWPQPGFWDPNSSSRGSPGIETVFCGFQMESNTVQRLCFGSFPGCISLIIGN